MNNRVRVEAVDGEVGTFAIWVKVNSFSVVVATVKLLVRMLISKQLYHVAITADGERVRLYINGKCKATAKQNRA